MRQPGWLGLRKEGVDSGLDGLCVSCSVHGLSFALLGDEGVKEDNCLETHREQKWTGNI